MPSVLTKLRSGHELPIFKIIRLTKRDIFSSTISCSDHATRRAQLTQAKDLTAAWLRRISVGGARRKETEGHPAPSGAASSASEEEGKVEINLGQSWGVIWGNQTFIHYQFSVFSPDAGVERKLLRPPLVIQILSLQISMPGLALTMSLAYLFRK